VKASGRYKRGTEKPGVGNMERYLQTSFRPVAPRPDFVTDLKTRLAVESRRFRSRSTVLQYVLLSLAGVVTSVLLIFAGVRAVITLLGILGILHQMRTHQMNSAGSEKRPTALSA
jgi:hypothetical protein